MPLEHVQCLTVGAILNSVWDNHLVITFFNATNEETYGIDTQTGEAVKLKLYYGDPMNYQILHICAEVGNYFLVQTDLISYTETYVDANGETWNAQREEPYTKMILKEDYWNSLPNFIDFADHVH